MDPAVLRMEPECGARGPMALPRQLKEQLWGKTTLFESWKLGRNDGNVSLQPSVLCQNKEMF